MISAADVAPLALAARAGDQQALERLLRLHLRPAHSVALSTLGAGRWADAADVVQKAFMIAVEKLSECREPASFTSWLLQIVRRTGLDENRALARARSRRDDQRLEDVPAWTTRDHAERDLLRRTLLAALALLPERQRQIVVLHDLEGFKHGEIAELLQISEGLSRQELFVARRELRSLLAARKTGVDMP